MVNVGINQEAIGVEVKNLEKLMTSNPKTFKRLQEIIRKDLWTARLNFVTTVHPSRLLAGAAVSMSAVTGIVSPFSLRAYVFARIL